MIICLANDDEPNNRKFDSMREEVVGTKVVKFKIGKKHNSNTLILEKSNGELIKLYCNPDYVIVKDASQHDKIMSNKDSQILDKNWKNAQSYK